MFSKAHNMINDHRYTMHEMLVLYILENQLTP
jgi:hypothetical protein